LIGPLPSGRNDNRIHHCATVAESPSPSPRCSFAPSPLNGERGRGEGWDEGFHVSACGSRTCNLEITNCDLKFNLRRTPLPPACFHRARRRHAFARRRRIPHSVASVSSCSMFFIPHSALLVPRSNHPPSSILHPRVFHSPLRAASSPLPANPKGIESFSPALTDAERATPGTTPPTPPHIRASRGERPRASQ
jgi:hypothetical protein